MIKTFPYSKQFIDSLVEKYSTPFHIYDEKAILENIRKMNKSFSILPGFKEYFAVKALPNPYILKSLMKEGVGADCSSLSELIISEKCGLKGEQIMFTSNNTPHEEFEKASQLGAIINFDDITHIEIYEESFGMPEIACIRYNPGPLKEGNDIIGQPQEAKYGYTREQVFEGYRMLINKGVKRFGIHTMIASNEIEEDYFIETATILFDLVKELSSQLGIEFEFINLGGGIGIPYKLNQDSVDYNTIAKGILAEYNNFLGGLNNKPKIFLECGRVITGPYGYLITKVIHKKNIYKNYIGVDACMANLMRPAIYGAYHHITVVGKDNQENTETYDVVGSLCENNDKFAINRKLPEIDYGDILAIHDTGAHGHAMGFNYNGKLRSKELLLREDGSVIQIRRDETLNDYFSTIDFSGLKNFE